MYDRPTTLPVMYVETITQAYFEGQNKEKLFSVLSFCLDREQLLFFSSVSTCFGTNNVNHAWIKHTVPQCHDYGISLLFY